MLLEDVRLSANHGTTNIFQANATKWFHALWFISLVLLNGEKLASVGLSSHIVDWLDNSSIIDIPHNSSVS